jgi:hypothetical protein
VKRFVFVKVSKILVMRPLTATKGAVSTLHNQTNHRRNKRAEMKLANEDERERRYSAEMITYLQMK